VPSTLGVVKRLKVTLDTKSTNIRTVARNFGPVFVSRGVVQISAYIDQWIATFLPTGIVATLGYSQTIYVLPVSLFGMSVSAAQLPEMSSVIGHEDEVAAFLRRKLDAGLRQIAFFVVPSAAAFLAFGDVIAGVLLRHGRFTQQDTMYAWGILAGSAVGLLASTMGRLYSSTYYALHDTRTPLRFAMVRVALTTVLGYLFAIPLPHLIGIDAHWGAAGLTRRPALRGGSSSCCCARASISELVRPDFQRVRRSSCGRRRRSRRWRAGKRAGWSRRTAASCSAFWFWRSTASSICSPRLRLRFPNRSGSSRE